jgi:branched-chain amino acid transport system substrate-binding protein
VNFGLKNQMTILLAWSAGLDQFQSLGSEIIEGIYMGAQYWHQVDSPMNNELVKAVKDAYGITPNYPMAGAYISTQVMLEGVKAAGEVSAKTISAIEGMSYQGPTGSEMVRAGDHQVIKDYYLLKGKAASEMKDPDDLAEVISSGQSFPAVSCKMA